MRKARVIDARIGGARVVDAGVEAAGARVVEARVEAAGAGVEEARVVGAGVPKARVRAYRTEVCLDLSCN